MAIKQKLFLAAFSVLLLPFGHLVPIMLSSMHMKGRGQPLNVAFVTKLLSAGILCCKVTEVSLGGSL